LGTQYDFYKTTGKFDAFSKLESKYLWFVPPRRASLDIGRDVRPTTPDIRVITKPDVAHQAPQYLQLLLAFMPKA
jgi:hypothetical protein